MSAICRAVPPVSSASVLDGLRVQGWRCGFADRSAFVVAGTFVRDVLAGSPVGTSVVWQVWVGRS